MRRQLRWILRKLRQQLCGFIGHKFQPDFVGDYCTRCGLMTEAEALRKELGIGIFTNLTKGRLRRIQARRQKEESQ